MFKMDLKVLPAHPVFIR